MIKACRSFISNDHKDTVWTQPQEELIQKIESCVMLNEEYKKCYRKLKDNNDKPQPSVLFCFSEMFVFGKFDLFCSRLQKISDLLHTISYYKHLLKSNVEGCLSGDNKDFEDAVLIFETAVTTIQEKDYDFFNHRDIHFNEDYTAFLQDIEKVKVSLISMLNMQFDAITSSSQAMKYLIKLMNIRLELNMGKKFKSVLHLLCKEIDILFQRYKQEKDNPPHMWRFAPIASRISWSQHLFQRIEEPMQLIKSHTNVLNGKEGKKVVQKYNEFAYHLVYYETAYHRFWLKQVPAVEASLHKKILAVSEGSYKLVVNDNDTLWTFVEEANKICKMGLEIPKIGYLLLSKQNELKKNKYMLLRLLKDYGNIKENVPPDLKLLADPHVQKVNDILSVGAGNLSWNSLNISAFVDGGKQAVDHLKTLIERASSIIRNRVEGVLGIINDINLFSFLRGPQTPEEILQCLKKSCQDAACTIQNYNMQIEKAVIEVIELFLNDIVASLKGTVKHKQKMMSQSSRSHTVNFCKYDFVADDNLKEKLENAAREIVRHYSHLAADSVIAAIQNGLQALYNAVINKSFSGGPRESHIHLLFKVDGSLCVPDITIDPNANYIQRTINRMASVIFELAKSVGEWKRQPHNWLEDAKSFDEVLLFDDENKLVARSLVPHMTSLYKYVINNKEIAKLRSLISNCLKSTREEISKELERYSMYYHLWEMDKVKETKMFVASKPDLCKYIEKMEYYKSIELQMLNEPDIITVGCIALFTDKIKHSISKEATSWYTKYGILFKDKNNVQMNSVFHTIEDLSKRLRHPIFDLDDIQFVMDALDEARDKEINLELTIEPVEECYAVLNKFKIPVKKDELDKVDSLQYCWKKLYLLVAETETLLVSVQPHFKQHAEKNLKSFLNDCEKYFKDYDENGPMIPGLEPNDALGRLTVFQNQFDVLWQRYSSLSKSESLFGIKTTKVPKLHRIKKELGLLQKLYCLYKDVINSVNGYYDVIWSELDVEKIIGELLEFQNRCRKLPKALKEWPAFNALKKTIDDFNEICPLLELMTNKAMKLRHWQRLEEITGHKFDVESLRFSLKNVLEVPLLSHKEDIEDVCISAQKEKDIEAKLMQVTTEWETNVLSFAMFQNRGELLLRGDTTAEIVSLLEDSLMVLSSLLSNRYNAPFYAEIQQWVQDLSTTNDVLERWLFVQNLWVYLEAVFVGGDIAKQLPKEANRFSAIDRSWTKIMNRAHEIPHVVKCCAGDDLMKQLLPHLQEQLEICQKSLTGYLEGKRLQFPRFFFVSDPALLEILGQASDSHSIQPHLLSIFDNTKSLGFDENQYNVIRSVASSEGETITLDRPVLAEGNVEDWLMVLLETSKSSLHNIIKKAADLILSGSIGLLEFLDTYLSQVGLLGLQIIWTREAEVALQNARKDKTIMRETNEVFLELLNKLIDQTTRNLESVERTKYETLITIHVHQRDIFDSLYHKKIMSPSDFEWQRQCRLYFKQDIDKTVISITNVNFTYQNEFLGCSERLVITPLTDRCYVTLTQALHMSMGGLPAGPAGTGKTETTKDMGKTLGKYVVVFNCSDQMDYRGLGRIFKGLAQSGTWGCFDEFNRIDLPVLSVAAQQIAIVLACKKEKQLHFTFSDGDTVAMNPEFGIFLTMNPGYAGRQELPENLKIQFRTVAMMVPDGQIIIRVKLASCGFLDNITLARKFYTLYNLCEEQLTKQIHYDFGLRNILSVLRTLGASKRQNLEDSENTIVMRVLRNMNLSKLIDEDEPLFLSLINDLFPGIHMGKKGYPELERCIKQEIENCGLVNHQPWMLKLIQLYETQLVRHGLMILGPPGAGKTTCIKVLMRALNSMEVLHREMRMNPKAITAPQMFGRLDAATNDWTDGIFSTLWRKTLKTRKGEHTWIILDGPVDAIWIENLNSVLDDNKTLTLANGDRIPMAPNCKIIFEVHNIDNASPATVSRNGMVYMSSSVLTWKPILQAWLQKCDTEAATILELFSKSFQNLYTWASQNLSFKMRVLEFNVISQALILLHGLLPQEQKDEQTYQELCKKLYTFALMWSIGAFLELNDRARLQIYLQNNFSSVLDLPPVDSGSKDTIFDYFVDNKGNWQHWKQQVEKISSNIYSLDYCSILVPNIDNIRTDMLIQSVAKQGKPVLLIGESGTAKTVMIKNFLKKYDNEIHLHKTFNFSSASTPLHFQQTVESYLEKRMSSTYGPHGGRKLTIFIDDINMPIINDWGDQVTNEIVRQTIELSGFYSLERPGEFIHIVDTQFLAAMCHPGGGRNDIPDRLKRHFAIFNCTLPSDPSVDKIFSVISSTFFCIDKGFSEEVCSFVQKLVPLTRKVWQETKGVMLPTPANFHYIFNLRDLSRIWQGMTNTQSSAINSTEAVLILWKHECLRVIADRFTQLEHLQWFETNIVRLVKETLLNGWSNIVEGTHFFADFLREAPDGTAEEENEMEIPKVYEPIPSFKVLEDRLKSFLTMYNDMARGAGLDLVFFEDAMIHLIKIARILRTPSGNALLVGVGGSGKQSLTKLASFIAGYKTFQITLTRTYSTSNLLEDLKALYKTAGIQDKGTTFIFTEQDVKEESFLEYINNILSSGVISNLFNRDEQSDIVQELSPLMKREHPREPLSQENILDYFMNRSRRNLHLVLCFSPVGEKFRSRALKFPGLISGCIIDWFQPWPKTALVAVAHHYLSDFDIECDNSVKNELEQAMGNVQECVAYKCQIYFERYRRTTHVTPKSYLSFIRGYKTIYKEKSKEIGELASRMEHGLAKLEDASLSVENLKKELAIMDKELEVATRTAEKVLHEVTDRAYAAEKVKDSVQEVKNRAQVLVHDISIDKAIAEEKLEVAKPALEEAEAALNTILPAHIATVRKLSHPPPLIMRIMDCVLILFQHKLQPIEVDAEKQCVKPSWEDSLKFMSSSGFLQALQNFKKDTMNDEVIELLEPYLKMSDYNMKTAKRVCGDVAGLLSWTKAMAFFFGVNKEVIPLKANLAIQENRLEVALEDLNRVEAELHEKEQELSEVKAHYEEAVMEKQRLVNQAALCRKKMSTATTLIGQLAGEFTRWTEQSKQFKDQIGRLAGDALLATGFLSYAGPFNQEFRYLLFSEWQKELSEIGIPFTENLDITEMLVDPTTVAVWTNQGLPNDELSIQNGIIVNKASCYPLLIDPQGQGKQWIKNKESGNKLQITSLDDKHFRQHLENCLSFGNPLLLEDVEEELDPVLDNILEKNFIKMGSIKKVMVGDKECDVMEGFSLYITTKLSNPAFSPEISARTAVIDFTVTMKGLEDQLLGRVILTEKSELESERVTLMKEIMENREKVKQLEDDVLYRLTSTEGSLVDDDDLIVVLHDTKEITEHVTKNLEVASKTQQKISLAREEFRPVATRGSIIYFLIVEMSAVNPMYQTSLHQFLALFDLSISRSARDREPSKRIANIISYLTYEVYKYSVRGLYERHKFLFTLLLALKINLHSGAISYEQFITFIKGGASLDLKAVPPKPFSWILDSIWLNLIQLSTLNQFSSIVGQVIENEKSWSDWLDTERPEEEDAPIENEERLTVFEKLLLIRTWCPDRTLSQARKYVAASLGEEYTEGIILDLESTWKESDNRTPLICLLSTGADPTIQIGILAKKHRLEYHVLSMGQGQEVHARLLVNNSIISGSWVMLQNCHLSLQFCSEILEVIQKCSNAHQQFRLWITAEVHPQFPISLLQSSIKFTNEPPQGIKASLKRIYASVPEDILQHETIPQWQQLLYAVAFLHTVVQERRKYGPLGWNIPYEFNQADFLASMQFLQKHVDDVDSKEGVCWRTVSFMLGDVQYGGRVTDNFDKRLLTTYTNKWFTSELFQADFSFCTGYSLPKHSSAEKILSFINTLPSIDFPGVFGLHSNADITYQINTAQELFDTIQGIQPKDTTTHGGETREAVVYRLANDMLNKLPQNYIKHEVRAHLRRMGRLAPMNIFLRQEIDRMQKVITVVRSTLLDLKLAIEGTIIMNESLRDALDSIYDAHTPFFWKKISWMSSTLGFWFTELLERDMQFKNWCSKGRPNAFWMTGFFNPQGFLTAMKQEITRAHPGWALDTVIQQSIITNLTKEEIVAPPPQGVYVYGLFLEGAAWNKETDTLTESIPKILFEPMPVVHIFAISSTTGRDSSLYECPVYKKRQRTDLNYIGSVDLKTDVDPSHWTLRGVALLCDIK